MSVADYLAHYATVTSMNVTAVTNNNATIQVWRLPWTDDDNADLKLKTVSGTLKVKNKVVNHVENTWYEIDTGSSTRGFVYGPSITLQPYYTGVKETSIAADNANVAGTCNNPGGVTLLTGGFYLSTKSNAVANGTKKTDNIPSSYQTAATIPHTHDFKNEYGITLTPGTTYYYVLYTTDSNGKSYYSEERSFTTTTIKVTGISVSPTSKTINLGGTQQLTATVTPSNATNKAVTWSSTNTAVATVSSSGLVTAKGLGSATIRATAADGSGKYATATITVTCNHSGGTTTIPAVAPTCTETGLTEGKKCNACGAVTVAQTTVPATGHSYGAWTQTKAPTCSSTGTEQRNCTKCSHYETRTVAATSHSYTSSVTAPTCTADGYTTYTCTGCGDSYTANIVAATGHSYSAWTQTKAPTCSSTGTEQRNCTKCSHYETRTVAATSHSYTSSVTAPTCTTDGYTTYTCTGCGNSYTDNTVPATGHRMGEWYVGIAPTTTEEGVEYRDCQNCRYYEERAIPVVTTTWEFDDATGQLTIYRNADMVTQTWVELRDSIKSVVLMDGVTRIEDFAFESCENLTSVTMSDNVTFIGDAAFHFCYSLERIVLSDNLESIGMYAFSECNSLNSITLPAALTTIAYGAFNECSGLTSIIIPGAVYSISDYAFRGCTGLTDITIMDGVQEIGQGTFYGCSGLKTLTIPSSVISIGDYAFYSDESYGEINIEKINYNGTDDQIEDISIGIYNDSLFNAIWYCRNTETEHSYEAVVTSPTCTESGYTTYTCTICGDIYTNNEVAALGHSFGEWVETKAPTVEEDGEETRECSVCGERESKPIAKLKLKAPVIKVSANTSTGKNKVSWEAVPGADLYRVYRASSKNGSYSRIKSTSSTSYTDTTAKVGTNYYYKVLAVNSETGEKSEYSAVVNRCCDLPMPKVKVSVDKSSGKPKVSWGKISGTAKFRVYRAEAEDGEYELIKTTTSTAYTDTTAKAGKTYYYKVRAIHSKSSANSAYSDIVSCVCDLKRPTVSIKLNKGDPKVTWKKISGASEYQVYRATSKSGTYKLVKTTTKTGYTDTSAKAGKTYYYKVKAVHTNSSANSAYSSVKSIKAK